jgi:hypothetical protein
MRRLAVAIVILAGSIGAAWAMTNGYSSRCRTVSDEILLTAQELRDATHERIFDSHEAEEILIELKDLIKEYEENMVFAESPYPGEILLGTTPGGDSTWLETLCSTRYDGLLKEIRIRRTGHRAKYLRINDIEIWSKTPKGPKNRTFNENGRAKLYHGDVFKLALPRPMRVGRIRININHKSTGLLVTGIPYDFHSRRRGESKHHGAEALLGTTPGGDSMWLETLCSGIHDRPIREIQLRRTGRLASYLRINDIEVTYRTHRGREKKVFNKNGRFKLYYDDVFKLSLPRPMRIIRIRILVGHKSTGLRVYGIR